MWELYLDFFNKKNLEMDFIETNIIFKTIIKRDTHFQIMPQYFNTEMIV